MIAKIGQLASLRWGRGYLGVTLVGVLFVVVLSGCSRNHYRLRADAYARLQEKARCKPWRTPGDYSVYPDPQSRLYDPTCVNDPHLPTPSPQLYAYQLPELPTRDASRFRSHVPAEAVVEPAAAEAPQPLLLDGPQGGDPSAENAAATTDLTSVFRSVSYSPGSATTELLAMAQVAAPRNPPPQVTEAKPAEAGLVTPLPEVAGEPRGEEVLVEKQNSDDKETNNNGLDEEMLADTISVKQVPLPKSYWESIPQECLVKMFAFRTVREEYARTYGELPDASLRDPAPKLTLEDVIDLTLLNSRELQTQKERLYRVALALTLERFNYQLRAGGLGSNGVDVNYINSSDGGDSILIPSTLQLQKMMYSGADFVGRFANDVVLQLNGPQGFTARISSQALFNFSQRFLQRDRQLENLTQSERAVVYAAREFTRFRKELFVGQTSTYYNLIRDFREIEIQCQNYFVLAREFNQRSVEIKFGMASRTQLDQVEQQVISGRQRILQACTGLENSLDNLKISMGIPTEQPLNLDLTELNLITLSDELAVNAELINRTRGRIQYEIESEERSPFVLVGSVSQLVEQMLDSIRLRRALGEATLDSTSLENRLFALRIEAADIDVAEDRAELETELADVNPDPTKVIQRRRDVSAELAKKISWQLRRLKTLDPQNPQLATWDNRYELLGEKVAELEVSFLDLIFRESTDALEANTDELQEAEQALITQSQILQAEAAAFAQTLDEQLQRTAASDPDEFQTRSLRYAHEVVAQSDQLSGGFRGGLMPIEIEMDDAMMTALVQRFDLMTQRGQVADAWRQIKYAADDLRSVLNLNASHSLQSVNRENQPFGFELDTDSSTTSASLSLDLPFNRRAQRNRFRTSLFDYQATLRNMMQLEDTIKLSVRRDLRTLKLDRRQYVNDVAGAALASERVTSTELEVRNGFATSRDFLESQQAYVRAISGVASDHINYIVDRLDLFLDLESLTVGDDGFWGQLYDENHQPVPYHQLPDYARPGYGELHPKLKYSRRIQRMRYAPDGTGIIHEPLPSEEYVDEYNE